jgi:hypothetical protein
MRFGLKTVLVSFVLKHEDIPGFVWLFTVGAKESKSGLAADRNVGST